MALNLSTLTSPATSGDVLAEALTTADFLEPVPVLRNLARGSQKGGDAKQDVALNQPKALPLIKNPQGNLGGYLYIPNVSGNYATGPSVTIGANQTWEAEVDMVITQFGNNLTPFGGGDWSAGFGMLFYQDGSVRLFSKGTGGAPVASGVTLGTAFSAKYGYDGTNIFVDIDGTRKFTASVGQSASITHPLELNQQAGLTHAGNYAIQKAKLTVNNAVVFDCDFNGSTSIRHGDTKFKASVGGPVTINQAGNDPATVIKKPVLRFDGTNDGFRGLFNQTIDGGYMFAAFSVLGTGGSGNDNRVFSVNANGAGDVASSGFVYGLQYGGSPWLASYGAGVYRWAHVDMYNDARGDILYETKAKSGGLISKVNNANKFQPTTTLAIASNEFNVGNSTASLARPAAIDLEYLALFPASITDAQADSVRNYINNRNNVFDLKDGFGYYFYDAQNAPVGNISSGSSSWNGRIVGSDNGDTDKLATQGTSNDAPAGDGYVVTFADNSDHLEIPQVTQAGWQIVGTSLGTFAYRVNANAVTELNLLGNLGYANYRKAGQSYGMILLPESATGADIEAARKLLIDRGAADGTTASSLSTYWFSRSDIIEFKHVNTSSVTSLNSSWYNATGLETFPLIDTTSVTEMQYAWENTEVSSFPPIQAPVCSNFTASWKSCSALTSFPAGAKLGTEAENVNFSSAWKSSGLTSFSTPLPTASNVSAAWLGAVHLSSFNTTLPLAVNCNSAWAYCSVLVNFNLTSIPEGIYFSQAFRNSGLVDFNTNLPKANTLSLAFKNCQTLKNFSVDVFSNWNPSSIPSGIFNDAWDGCSSLTAQSVENILTSIDASGKYATSTGASGGSALADAGIDIDYNVATGSLSAATNAAVDSLKAKGWSIIVNNVTL